MTANEIAEHEITQHSPDTYTNYSRYTSTVYVYIFSDYSVDP